MSEKCTAPLNEWVYRYKYSTEIIKVLLKERIPAFFRNKHTTAEIFTQTMDDCKFYCQNKYSSAL